MKSVLRQHKREFTLLVARVEKRHVLTDFWRFDERIASAFHPTVCHFVDTRCHHHRLMLTTIKSFSVAVSMKEPLNSDYRNL